MNDSPQRPPQFTLRSLAILVGVCSFWFALVRFAGYWAVAFSPAAIGLLMIVAGDVSGSDRLRMAGAITFTLAMPLGMATSCLLFP